MPRVNCGFCERTFYDKQSADQHQRAKGHCYCYECERSFRSERGYADHKRIHIPNHSFTSCPSDFCSHVFCSWSALEHHQRTLGHCFCLQCNKFFGSDRALSHHLDTSPVHQASHFYCCDCEREFSTERGLEQHLEDKYHAGRSLYQCTPCEKAFQSENALQAHLASWIHQLPGQSIECPACHRWFALHSALVQHLESGACKKSRLDRKKINALLARLDSQRLITDGVASVKFAPVINPDLLAEKLQKIQITPASCCASTHEPATYITNGNNSPVTASFDNPTPTFVYTPASTSTGTSDNIWFSTPDGFTPTSIDEEASNMNSTIIITPASPMAMTKTQKQCPLCPLRHFSSQQALQSHLMSAAHDPKYLRCPSLIPGEPGDPHLIRRFSLPSALFQHLEAGVCKSGAQTAEVKEGLKALQDCLSRVMRVKGSVKWLTAAEA